MGASLRKKIRDLREQYPHLSLTEARDFILKTESKNGWEQGLWFTELGIENITTWNPEHTWNSTYSANIRVPIGITPEGIELRKKLFSPEDPNASSKDPNAITGKQGAGKRYLAEKIIAALIESVITLDIAQVSSGGTGPHGALAGMTGSGKSMMLENVVTGLAAKHSPFDLQFVLLDFKGGAVFNGYEKLPHVVCVRNCIEEHKEYAPLVREAVELEMQRREETLRASGSRDVQEYNASRNPSLRLPHVLIVVDEFREALLSEGRDGDIKKLFTRVGSKGRSLGMHLLLSAQSFDEHSLSGVSQHLNYGISLRVNNAPTAHLVVGTDEATQLPHGRGEAILRRWDGTTEKFTGFNTATEIAPGIRAYEGIISRISAANVTGYEWGTAVLRDKLG